MSLRVFAAHLRCCCGRLQVGVFYTGTLATSGKQFDSCTKKPFSFTLGKNEVIKGWDLGLQGEPARGQVRTPNT